MMMFLGRGPDLAAAAMKWLSLKFKLVNLNRDFVA